MDDNQKRQALDAIRRGLAAQVERDYPEQLKTLETKAKNRVESTTGVEAEDAVKAAALLKMAADLSQGRFEQNIDGYGVEAEYTPEEKRIMLKKDWSF